jgi:hypothetical protein
MEYLATIAKAITAFVVVLAGALLTVLTGDMALSDLTLSQWLGIVVLIGGAPTAVYAVPNSD